MKLTDEQIIELIVSLPWKANAQGYSIIKRAALVAYLKHGRAPAKNEVIHHVNEDKADDRPDNLLIVSRKEHAKIHKNLEGHRGIKYTPELRAKRSEQMTGNKHALGHRASPEWRARRSELAREINGKPEARQHQSDKMKEVWQKRRDGLLPLPKHGNTVH